MLLYYPVDDFRISFRMDIGSEITGYLLQKERT